MAVATVLSWLAVPAPAQEGFRVTGVAVEATAADALAARTAAQSAGVREAWRRLVAAQAPAEAARLATLPDADLARLVESFEVADEQITARRYSATMTVLFRPAEVRALFARGLGAGSTVEARARFASLAEWTEIRRRLAASPAVSQVDLRSLSGSEARLTLTLAGSPERAAQALSAAGLALTKGAEGWTLALVAP